MRGLCLGQTVASALVCLIGLSFVAGCSGQEDLQPIDVRAISAVQAEIKRQVGVYMAAAKVPPLVLVAGKPVPATQAPGGFWCGSGAIDFNISTIKAELTTTLDTTESLNVGVTVPFHGGSGTLSGGVKKEFTNTQVLDYNLWPLEIALQNPDVSAQNPSEPDIKGAPIAQVLRDLRNALVLSAMRLDYSNSNGPISRGPQPCFTDYDPDKPVSDAGNTFKIGLSVENNVNGGISITASLLNISASETITSTTGNTLTVSFVQQDLDQLQYARDAIDDACKYPKRDTSAGMAKCAAAKAAYAALRKNPAIGVGILKRGAKRNRAPGELRGTLRDSPIAIPDRDGVADQPRSGIGVLNERPKTE
jgi:hypothetical protein